VKGYQVDMPGRSNQGRKRERRLYRILRSNLKPKGGTCARGARESGGNDKEVSSDGVRNLIDKIDHSATIGGQGAKWLPGHRNFSNTLEKAKGRI